MSGDFWRRLKLPWLGRRDVEAEVDDELSFHMEMRARERAGEGVDPEEARRRAADDFGDVDATRRRYVEQRTRRVRRDRRSLWLSELLQDLHLGLRHLARYPTFAWVVVLTLALGIGVDTAVFTVVDTVLLRPLPYRDADRLVRITGTNEETGDLGLNLSPPDVADLAASSSTLAAIAAFSPASVPVTGRGDATVVNEVLASPSILDVLAVQPILGRGFTAEENEPDGPRAVVLSHGFWSRVMGADSSVIGSTLVVGTDPHVVVGVLPEGLAIPTLPPDRQPALLRPLRISPLNGRGGHWLRAIGRLGPETSVQVANDELGTIARGLEAQYPETNTGRSVRVEGLKQATVGNAATALWVLQGAVLLVLLIACANVANLMLVRASSRAPELAVRRAMGAGGLRLARQLATESGVLSLLGGAGGLLIAMGTTRVLTALPGTGIPRLEELQVNVSVLSFCFATALVAGLAAGLAPLARALRADVRTGLVESGSRGHSGGRRVWDALVASEAALALVLLVGAGLLIRSFDRLVAEDPGVDTDNTEVVEIILPQDRYPSRTDIGAFYADWVPRVAELPGVRAVGGVNNLPFLYESCDGFGLPDRPDPPPGQRPCASNQLVTPGYFGAAGIDLVEGRAFTAADRADARPVAIVSQVLAERFWPDRSALGELISYNGIERVIVGVSRAVRRLGLSQDAPPEMFIPHAQDSWERQVFLIVRADDADVAVREVRASLAETDPNVPIGRVLPLERLVSGTVAEERFRTAALGGFAALALLLAGIGIYGVMAHAVSQRRRELGIRLALGADGASVRLLVVGHALRVAAVGLLIGGVASLAGTRALEGLLYEIGPLDPPSALAAALILLAVAALGSYLPARRAASTDPLTTLKTE